MFQIIKKNIFLMLLLSHSTLVFGQVSEERQVNSIMALSRSLSLNYLLKVSGSHKCVSLGQEQATYGDTKVGAHLKAVVFCVKQECNRMQKEIKEYIESLKSLSAFELKDLLNSMDKSSYLQLVTESLNSSSKASQINCDNSVNAQYMVYHYCSSQIYKCN